MCCVEGRICKIDEPNPPDRFAQPNDDLPGLISVALNPRHRWARCRNYA